MHLSQVGNTTTVCVHSKDLLRKTSYSETAVSPVPPAPVGELPLGLRLLPPHPAPALNWEEPADWDLGGGL